MNGCAVAMWTNSRQSTARPVPLAAELGYLHPGGGSGERRGGYGRGEMPAGGEWRDNVAGWSGGPRPDDTRPTEEFSPLNYRGRRRVEGPMPEVMAGPPRQAVPRPVRPAPVSVPATGPETEPRGGRVLLTAAIVCVLLLVLTVWVRWPRDSGNAAPPDNGAEATETVPDDFGAGNPAAGPSTSRSPRPSGKPTPGTGRTPTPSASLSPSPSTFTLQPVTVEAESAALAGSAARASCSTPATSAPVTISLKQGSNTIRFYNNTTDAPDLDAIRIS